MFNIGDKVISSGCFDNGRLGVVKRITPSGRIVVDFGTYTETYRSDGYSVGNDSIYNKRHIELATEVDLQRIRDKNIIRKCESLFKDTNITADQAKRIIEILKEDN